MSKPACLGHWDKVVYIDRCIICDYMKECHKMIPPAPLDPTTTFSRNGSQFTSSSLEGGTWTRSTKD